MVPMDRPQTHKYFEGCNCEGCHEAHVDEEVFPVDGCRLCDELEEALMNRGVWCHDHGASYMQNGVCNACREDGPCDKSDRKWVADRREEERCKEREERWKTGGISK